MKTSANVRQALMALRTFPWRDSKQGTAYWAGVSRNLLEEAKRLEMEEEREAKMSLRPVELKDTAEQIAEAVAEAMTKLEKENQTPMPKVVVIQHLTLATGGGARALAPGSVYHEAPPPSHR